MKSELTTIIKNLNKDSAAYVSNDLSAQEWNVLTNYIKSNFGCEYCTEDIDSLIQNGYTDIPEDTACRLFLV